MKGYFHKWVEMSDTADDFESLADLVLREQFLNCCPKEVVGFVKERKSRSLGEVTESAERYVFAHGLHTFSSNPRSDTCRSQSNNVNRSQSRGRNLFSSPMLGSPVLVSQYRVVLGRVQVLVSLGVIGVVVPITSNAIVI